MTGVTFSSETSTFPRSDSLEDFRKKVLNKTLSWESIANQNQAFEQIRQKAMSFSQQPSPIYSQNIQQKPSSSAYKTECAAFAVLAITFAFPIACVAASVFIPKY